ncbi:SNF2-related protein [Thauera mechernichensis]|uniref:SNF2-related protein n=1 Tax=Thauera mechernichensis TaxID=82788 RepID=A0ABW3WDT5_9RHOO|nr:DEAD/DEAH box helicase [Thauera mechernichensis]MDG3065483.1 DEAD/DEAH box helicase [Thauera mechernichensis]
MTPLDRFTQDDLIAQLGMETVAKGLGYLSRVSALSADGCSVSALVKGRQRTPYDVSADVIEEEGRPALVSACTCPMGYGCKHVAAMMLVWLHQRRRPDRPREQVRAWVEGFRQAARALEPGAAGKPQSSKTTHALHYVIEHDAYSSDHRVACYKVRLDQHGQIRQHERWNNIERALQAPPAFVVDDDHEILRLLWAHRPHGRPIPSDGVTLEGRHSNALMASLLASGRAHYDGLATPVLSAGEARPGTPDWTLTADGLRAPVLKLDPAAARVLPLLPPWYIDTASASAGPITLDLAPELVQRMLWLPPLTQAESELVAETLAEVAPTLPPPTLRGEPPVEVSGTPVPILRLETRPVLQARYRSYAAYGTYVFDFALLAFRYGPVTIDAGDGRLFLPLPDGRSARLTRDETAERVAAQRLATAGFTRIPPGAIQGSFGPLPADALGLASEAEWPTFMADTAAALRAEGWTVEFPSDFRHHAIDIDHLMLDIDEHQDGWLGLSPGIEVDGKALPLAPLLAGLFAHDARWLSGRLDDIDDHEALILEDQELGRLRISAGRVKPLVRALVDLFDRPDHDWRLSRLDATRLAELDLPGRGHDLIAQLSSRLRGATGIAAVQTPKGFGAELRPYQLEGLAWLQHLVRHDLAGILADDMGLGKTAQTLAHLLTEKHAGRLDVPALVILPTSLVFNWQAEAERFAPGLKVLNLHGSDRHARFDELDADVKIDVALTTYPLLWRDAEQLQARQWSLLILDEAQTVKNAASKGAQVIRQLKARHRLGLTGTPLENHLGELWAQFDFLLPGFLGTHKQFTQTWRTPIEKHGDSDRRDLLAARLRPFILRRRKEDVATELPPKTIIVRSVGLEGGQRDLYETVRAAMDEKVRAEIAGKGFARSQIVILDALLKLRQVCCDPRLLKSPAAARVKERAKLDLLMDMLPELIDEGRRILVFSQFTSMLSLIAAELDKAKIGWVALTGDTRDRRIPVEDFQKGRVPVFLISLKAGGVGLNLTAADTVIHYDPWWNPAAENQATDRAHRIGQDKPVFVFKLVCAGSIEEKILALQEKKAALAEGVLSEDANALAKFGEADIAALLAPLPPAGR